MDHRLSRILLVVQSVSPGGMEAHAVDLAAEFAGRGHAVAAVATTEALAARFAAAGAEATVVATDARGGRIAELRGAWRFVRLLRSWRPDVVHLHTGGATGGLLVVALARLATHATVVHTEHDVPAAQPARWRARLLKRVSDLSCHALVAVSRRNAGIRQERLPVSAHKVAAVLNGVPSPRVEPVPDPALRVSTRSLLRIPTDAVVVGSVVRLAANKGIPDLIRAFAMTRAEPPPVLLLVGDGPLRGEAETLARELGVDERVRFAGFRANPVPYLDAMDVFALAVPSGSMSIALLEAMVRALPPVITFCGPEEAVVDGETGLSALPGDPADLARALQALIDDAALRERLGAAAAVAARHQFSVARVANDLLEIYATAGASPLPARLRADRPVARGAL